MPLGVADTWVDGFESYVIVGLPDPVRVVERFGRVVRWWPEDPSALETDPWIRCPLHDAAWASARRSIGAFAAREAGLLCVAVQVGRSNSAVGSEDDDYHRPMYEDAAAALRLEAPRGPELYETPVRVAARLSEELACAAVALWGSDQEPALEGIALWESGDPIWTASAFTREEVASARAAYDEGRSVDLDGPEGRAGAFFLYRPGAAEESLPRGIESWADERLREAGLGIDLSLSLHNTHPFDIVRSRGAGLSDFVVAVGDPVAS